MYFILSGPLSKKLFIMKKINISLLLLTLFFSTNAQESLVKAETIQSCSSDTIVIPVIIENLDSVATISLGLDLDYDTSQLTLIGCELSSNLNLLSNCSIMEKHLTIGWFSTVPLDIELDTLVVLKFLRINSGCASLEWEGSCYITDVDQDPIIVNFVDGEACFLNEAIFTIDILEQDPVSCLGQSDGSILVNANDGSSNYLYQWSTGGTGPLQDNLAVGTYELTISDSNGCTSEIQVDILQQIDTISPTVLTQDITIILDVNGEYSISPEHIDNGSFDNCGIDSMIIYPSEFDCDSLGEKIVTLTVIDNDGNQNQETAIVTVESGIYLEQHSEAQSDNTNPNGFIFIDNLFGGLSPYSYYLELNDSAIFNGNTISIGDTINSLSSGEYKLVITDSNGCSITEFITIEFTTATSSINEHEGFSVFPNPTNGLTKIALDFYQPTNIEIRIINTNGQLLMAFSEYSSTNKTLYIDLSGFSSGMYYVNLVLNEKSYFEKVVLLK